MLAGWLLLVLLVPGASLLGLQGRRLAGYLVLLLLLLLELIRLLVQDLVLVLVPPGRPAPVTDGGRAPVAPRHSSRRKKRGETTTRRNAELSDGAFVQAPGLSLVRLTRLAGSGRVVDIDCSRNATTSPAQTPPRILSLSSPCSRERAFFLLSPLLRSSSALFFFPRPHHFPFSKSRGDPRCRDRPTPFHFSGAIALPSAPVVIEKISGIYGGVGPPRIGSRGLGSTFDKSSRRGRGSSRSRRGYNATPRPDYVPR